MRLNLGFLLGDPTPTPPPTSGVSDVYLLATMLMTALVIVLHVMSHLRNWKSGGSAQAGGALKAAVSMASQHTQELLDYVALLEKRVKELELATGAVPPPKKKIERAEDSPLLKSAHKAASVPKVPIEKQIDYSSADASKWNFTELVSWRSQGSNSAPRPNPNFPCDFGSRRFADLQGLRSLHRRWEGGEGPGPHRRRPQEDSRDACQVLRHQISDGQLHVLSCTLGAPESPSSLDCPGPRRESARVRRGESNRPLSVPCSIQTLPFDLLSGCCRAPCPSRLQPHARPSSALSHRT
jgi:hypothetical protein